MYTFYMAVYTRATHYTFSPDDTFIYSYWVVGDSAKPVLLILSGLTGTHTDLLEITERLRDHYYIIIPDLPGWGESPRFSKRLSIRNYALYIHELLRHIKVHDFYLLGHCMGATIAIEYTTLFPKHVQKLILVSTPYYQGAITMLIIRWLSLLSLHAPVHFRWLFYLWRNRFFDFIASIYILQFRSYKKKFRLARRGWEQRSLQNEESFEENWVSLLAYRYHSLRHLEIPILLIHGEKDRVIAPIQAGKLQRLIPQAKLVYLEHAGHIPVMETPQTLATLVDEFLQN